MQSFDGIFETIFWILIAANMAAQLSVQSLTGLMVTHWGIRVNYTRKINHFCLFFFPMALSVGLEFRDDLGTFIVKSVLAVGLLAVYVEPMRRKIGWIALMFRSYDRPEDRPYTLLWLSTQIAVACVIALVLMALMLDTGYPELFLIAIIVNGLGDGLAEPVGVRFGRHKFRTRALFSDRTYTRSLEGSACVFLSGFLAVWLYQAGAQSGQFIGAPLTEAQLWLAYATLPVAMTLAEAYSPHTWDSPFLFLVGGGLPLLIVTLV